MTPFPLIVAACLLTAEVPSAGARAILDKFRVERTEATKTFDPAELATADATAERAEASLRAGDPGTAARLAREARWLIPFRPVGLPPHVGRVLGAERLRHADRVNALAYSPDGTRLASASGDGTVRVWDLGNGRELAVYRGHAESEQESAATAPPALLAAGVAFSPDGETVASSGRNDIHLWDSGTAIRKQVLRGHQGVVKSLAWGADANTLVSGSDDRTVIVWDLAAGKPAFTSPQQARWVEAVAISPAGSLVASANANGELTVYALAEKKSFPPIPVTEPRESALGVAFVGSAGIATAGADGKVKLTAAPTADGPTGGSVLRTFTGHLDKVSALAATPDGKRLVSGGTDRTVRVWNPTTGQADWTFRGHQKGVSAVAVRPDGAEVASGSDDGTIRLWPLTPADEHRVFADSAEPLWAVTVSPDGSKFAAAGADRAIRVYDAATGRLTRKLTGHKSPVTALTFLGPDRLASAGGDTLVKVWKVSDGSAVDFPGHTKAVLALAASPDGRHLVSGSADNSVKMWDVGTGKAEWTWAGKSAVAAVAIRPGGTRVVVGTADGGLILLPVPATGERGTASTPAHMGGTTAVAFSSDGSRLASVGGDGVVRLWAVSDAGPPTPVAKFEPPAAAGSSMAPLVSVAFSPDGSLVTAGGKDPTSRVWDVRTGAEVRSLRGAKDWVTSLAFRPDGRELFASAADGAIRAFELSRPEAAPSGHTLPVLAVAFSPDGRRVATGSEDRSVKVWDAADGRELAAVTGLPEPVTAVGFAGPDQLAIAGSRPEGKLRWWKLNPPAEVRTAPVAGSVFYLAADPAGSRVAVVWTPLTDKYAAFEVFPHTGPSALVADKGRDVTCAAVTPDGTLGATGSADGLARVWDLAAKDRRGGDWPLFAKRVADIALTPDKKTLFAIDEDGTVKVADIADREVTATVRAATGEVVGLVVSPTGDRFAVIATTGEVKAWDTTGREIRAWKLPTAPNVAAFAPDGKRLVTGNKDGTAYVLDLP